jgi:hypothetical protein
MIFALLLLVGVHTGAMAYIGPGLGAGILSVILGLIGSVFLAIVAIFWYPIKRIMRRLKAPARAAPEKDPHSAPGPADDSNNSQ